MASSALFGLPNYCVQAYQSVAVTYLATALMAARCSLTTKFTFSDKERKDMLSRYQVYIPLLRKKDKGGILIGAL